MSDMNNMKLVQKQIRAFNKAWSRADNAKLMTSDYNEMLSDIIGAGRLTKAGYAKAGTKYLENMSDYELMALSADIESARNALETAKITSSLDIYDVKITDPKSAIWSTYNNLLDRGYDLDSDQVKTLASLADENPKVKMVDVLKEMRKVLTKDDYGVSDFADYIKGLSDLE